MNQNRCGGGHRYGLPAAIGANSRDEGLICPARCGAEAAWASPDIQIVAAHSLIQIANHFKGTQVLSRPLPRTLAAPTGGTPADFAAALKALPPQPVMLGHSMGALLAQQPRVRRRRPRASSRCRTAS